MVRRRGRATASQGVLVQPITTAMEKLTVSNRRRRVRRRVAYNNNNVPAGQGSVAVVVPSGRSQRARRAGSGGNVGNGGQITIKRTELFATIKSGAGKDSLSGIPIHPGTSSDGSGEILGFLGKLSNCYTRLRWNSLSFEWKPAVGTNTNGLVTYGVRLMDDRTAQVPKSRAEVSGLYPVCDHPVWQKSTLPVAKSLLMSRNWYATPVSVGKDPDAGAADKVDLAPGTLCVGAISSEAATVTLGEIWATYSVTLDGTRSEN